MQQVQTNAMQYSAAYEVKHWEAFKEIKHWQEKV